MSLQVIFDDFGKRLQLLLPEVIFADPRDRQDTSRPQRVSWRPVAGSHEPSRRLAGDPGDDGDILTRRWTIETELWGQDLEHLEALVNAFLNVAHRELSQFGYAPSQELWRVGGASTESAVCLMSFTLMTPIPRQRVPTLPIAEVDVTYTMEATP